MHKSYLLLLPFLFISSSVRADDFKYPMRSWASMKLEEQRLKEAVKRAEEAARVQREKSAQANTQRLVGELQKTTPDLNRVRTYLKNGAKPCAALPLAVNADNAPVVGMLSNAKDRCDWDAARDVALTQAMRRNKLRAFAELTKEPVTCPEPFGFNPRVEGSRWHPLSGPMLSAVTDRCYRTPEAKQSFFEFSLLKLNPGDRSVFWLGDAYEFGVKGNTKTEQAWLDSIALMVHQKKFKFTDDMLVDVVALGRSPSIYGDSFLPFTATRQVVLLGLKGGANGKNVLHRLDTAENDWVWKKYSKQERWRLSNIMEGRPEGEDRSWGARAVREVQSWF